MCAVRVWRHWAKQWAIEHVGLKSRDGYGLNLAGQAVWDYSPAGPGFFLGPVAGQKWCYSIFLSKKTQIVKISTWNANF